MSEAQTLALALREEPQAVMLTQHQLVVIANTDFVPKALRGNVAAVLACVARGRAMGIPDMVALNGISIIEGKATLTAELMSAIAREHGHSITGSVTDTEAIVRGKRGDNGDTMEVRFTMEMADTAGLTNKFNWKKHPDDMLWARAVSKLCRRLFADCYAGGTYTPEEMEPDADTAGLNAGLTADEVIDTPLEVRPNVVSPPPDEKAGEPGESLPDSPADLGDVSPWQQLLDLAGLSGIKAAEVKTVAKNLYAGKGKTPNTLTADECSAIWKHIEQTHEQLKVIE